MRDRIVLWLLPDVIVSILPWTHVELLLAIPQVLAHGSLNILVSNASKHSDLPACTAPQLVAKTNKLAQQLLPYARQGSSKHADILLVRWHRKVPGQLHTNVPRFVDHASSLPIEVPQHCPIEVGRVNTDCTKNLTRMGKVHSSNDEILWIIVGEFIDRKLTSKCLQNQVDQNSR